MRLLFGKGDILITECGNAEERNILIESSKGIGIVGIKSDNPERIPGTVIDEETLNNATCTLTFINPDSLCVLLEKVLVGMVSFRNNGRFVSKENTELVQSCKQLYQELCDNGEEVLNDGSE